MGHMGGCSSFVSALPWNQVIEIRAISDEARNRPIREATEEREVLAEQLANTRSQSEAPGGTTDDEDDPTIFEWISQGP